MVGYTPELVVAVWMGFDEGRPLGLSSTQAAVPLWIEFFEQIEPLLAGADFERPRGSYEAGRGGHGRKRLRSDRQLQRELEREDRSRRRMEEAAQRAMDR